MIGTHTREQAADAKFANGARIRKAREEPGDGTPLGTGGTVIGSIGVPELGVGYFVEWDDKPGLAVFVVEWKIAAAGDS